jgi:hypothetical protein
MPRRIKCALDVEENDCCDLFSITRFFNKGYKSMTRRLSRFSWQKTMLIHTNPPKMTGVPLKSRQKNFFYNFCQVIDKIDWTKAVKDDVMILLGFPMITTLAVFQLPGKYWR